MTIPFDPPLQIGERIRLDATYHGFQGDGCALIACFDGAHVVVSVGGCEVLRLTPLAMAKLFWLNGRICDIVPAWAIALSKAPP